MSNEAWINERKGRSDEWKRKQDEIAVCIVSMATSGDKSPAIECALKREFPDKIKMSMMNPDSMAMLLAPCGISRDPYHIRSLWQLACAMGNHDQISRIATVVITFSVKDELCREMAEAYFNMPDPVTGYNWFITLIMRTKEVFHPLINTIGNRLISASLTSLIGGRFMCKSKHSILYYILMTVKTPEALNDMWSVYKHVEKKHVTLDWVGCDLFSRLLNAPDISKELWSKLLSMKTELGLNIMGVDEAVDGDDEHPASDRIRRELVEHQDPVVVTMYDIKIAETARRREKMKNRNENHENENENENENDNENENENGNGNENDNEEDGHDGKGENKKRAPKNKKKKARKQRDTSSDSREHSNESNASASSSDSLVDKVGDADGIEDDEEDDDGDIKSAQRKKKRMRNGGRVKNPFVDSHSQVAKGHKKRKLAVDSDEETGDEDRDDDDYADDGSDVDENGNIKGLIADDDDDE